MRIAIISDIHDNIPKLRSALSRLDGAEVLICCGDLCSPFIVKELGEGFSGPIHIVFGNNDGDHYRITEGSKKYPHMHIHGEFVELELGDRKFGVNHFDNIGRAMVGSGHYDVVCFGHSHEYHVRKEGDTLVINPGEIFGLLTGHATFVLYDTEKNEALRVDVE